jgi:hypothetical protein
MHKTTQNNTKHNYIYDKYNKNSKVSGSDLLAQLTEGISKLTTSFEWQRFLEFQSRFHQYSFSNVILIARQCPSATQVAGYNTWLKLGRNVIKGEKAIWILAPMAYRHKNSDTDENTDVENVSNSTTGNNKNEKGIRGFRRVPVFDVTQTEGDQLPSVCTPLVGDCDSYIFPKLVGIANSVGFNVEDARLEGSINGDCIYELSRIRIEISNSPVQRVKTLIHEIAHAILHAGHRIERELAELEAESIAYIVCQLLGIDSSGYSFGYVANWAGGGEKAVAGIKASCERIAAATTTILSGLDITNKLDIADRK